MPRLFIISGCNGSGKTTASYTLLPEMLECAQFVNSDEFAKGLSPFDPQAASVIAGRYMFKKIQYLFERREDFCIETTLATRSLMRMIGEARENGYFTTIIYLWLNSPDLAVKRVKDRVASGGHDIDEKIIRRRYDMGLVYFFNEYIKICDRWILADNSTYPFTVIAEGNPDDAIIRNREIYEQIVNDIR